MRVLVSGSNGFIGQHVCSTLSAAGHEVLPATRSRPWQDLLQSAQAVVHLANIAHRAAAADELRRVNVEGTRALAQAAAQAGASRFVFVSSIKALGEVSPGRALREDDAPQPGDAYGASKLDAERALASVSDATGLDVTILRPPLVYGAGVKANFLRLLRLVDRGLPLPFRSIRNRRSFVYAGNLASAVLASLTAARASRPSPYLVDDGEPVSTPDLVRQIARALGRRALLVPCPAALLRPVAARLTDDLEVSSARLRAELGWQPPFTRQEGLERTAAWYRGLHG